MRISEEGINLIKSLEGFSPVKYRDAGVWAIGFGHDFLPGESFSEPMTEEQGTELLRKDVLSREDAVNFYVKVPLSQSQFDALISFVYNIGIGAFKRSTLLILLNYGDYNQVPVQMRRWVRSEGKENKVLKARRETEITLFLKKEEA